MSAGKQLLLASLKHGSAIQAMMSYVAPVVNIHVCTLNFHALHNIEHLNCSADQKLLLQNTAARMPSIASNTQHLSAVQCISLS